MSAMSDYLESKILNAVFRNTPYISPTNVYLALFKTAPSDASVGQEIDKADYSRKVISFSTPENIEGVMTIKNDSPVMFDAASTNWGTITHVAIMDAETAGNMLYYGNLSQPKEINIGDVLVFLVNDIQIGID